MPQKPIRSIKSYPIRASKWFIIKFALTARAWNNSWTHSHTRVIIIAIIDIIILDKLNKREMEYEMKIKIVKKREQMI